MTNEIYAFMDENADYVIIVGTDDRVAAEKALRKTEEEWFGKLEDRNPDDQAEQPISMDDFSAADIHVGTYKGEEGVYYWGDSPQKFFDGAKFTTEDGFIHAVN